MVHVTIDNLITDYDVVEGPLFALYKVMNGIEDVAHDEGRDLTPDEEALIAELRRTSHASFKRSIPTPLEGATDLAAFAGEEQCE